MTISKPYRTTPVFNQVTLPPALRREHNTKAGVWGVIHVVQGSLRYIVCDTGHCETLGPDQTALIRPQQDHFVEPVGDVSFYIEFYDHLPIW